MTQSFCQRFIHSCERRPDKVAMRVVGDDSEVYTYGELLRQTRAVAFRLEQEKIEKGDRVALVGENHPCWEIAYLATLYRGAVCVPLDPHGEIETITNFLENSEARLAFLAADEMEKFRQIEEKLGRHIPAVVWENNSTQRRASDAAEKTKQDEQDEKFSNLRHLRESAVNSLSSSASDARLCGSNNGFQSFNDWTNAAFPVEFARKIPDAGGDDIALLIYTSGTTGQPKAVPLTHGNIVSQLDGINEVLKIREMEKILSLLPLFHVYLQIVNLWAATTYGCEVGYLKELTPDELGKAMREFKPTILTTVPRLWYLFHKKIFDAVEAKPKPVQMLFKTMLAANGVLRDTFKINLGQKFFARVHESFGGNLRFAITAGSRFDEKAAIDFHRLGFTILQGYGLTETSGAATATYENDNRVGSVGKPFFNAEVKIHEPDAEGVGEVLIRGEMVFKGYYKNAEATRQAFTEDGWFRSGDLGKFDKDGHLYIVGRAKDVIVLPSGKNVHPEDLEVHYLKSPMVEELAILGVKDESAGRAGAEKLVAVIVPDFAYLKANNIANSREAIRHELDNLGRELPEYQRVRDYIIRVEPLPRTATRKIRRFELQKEIESGAISAKQARDPKQLKLSDEDKNLLDSTAGKAVAAIIKRNAKDAETIHPAMNLEIDLGLDSLARAEVFAALEQAFGFEFDGDEAAQALTVKDAVHLVRKHAGEAAETTTAISADLNWSKIVRETGTDLPEIRYVLKNRPVFSAFAWSVYKIFKLFCKIFMRLEVRGLENLRLMRRPFIVCPNHQSYFDPFIVCSNYPLDFFKNTFHVGASEFFQNFFMRWLARLLNVVPIDPDTQLMRAMKAGAAGLKSGKVLNIYPEGERAFDGELHEFKKGAAILATELDLPILPVALDGVHKVWARASWRIRPAKVKVRFGEPFYAKEIVDAEMSDETKYAAVTKHLKDTIAAMIDEMRK